MCDWYFSHLFASISRVVRELYLVVLLLLLIHFFSRRLGKYLSPWCNSWKGFQKNVLMTLRLISVMRRLGSYYALHFITFLWFRHWFLFCCTVFNYNSFKNLPGNCNFFIIDRDAERSNNWITGLQKQRSISMMFCN